VPPRAASAATAAARTAPAVTAATAAVAGSSVPVGFGAPAFRETLGLAYFRQRAYLQDLGGADGGGGGGGDAMTAAADARTRSAAQQQQQQRAEEQQQQEQEQQQDEDEQQHMMEIMMQQQQQHPGSGNSCPLPSASAADAHQADSEPIFRASVLGLLGPSPSEAGAELDRLAAERHARQPLGPRPLEAAVMLFRDMATRAALLLRRLDLLARERTGEDKDDPGGAGATTTTSGGRAAIAQAREEVEAVAVSVVVWNVILLKYHPDVLDELIMVRLDEDTTRSPPTRHDDHELQSRLGCAAVRAAKLSPAQHATLKSAFEAFTRQMADPARLMRQAGRQLTRQLSDPALVLAEEAALMAEGVPPFSSPPSPPAAAATAPSSRQLLETIERCAAACSMHRVLIGIRTYSIVTPVQCVGLVADCYPFMMRPGSLYSAFLDAESIDVFGAPSGDEDDEGG